MKLNASQVTLGGSGLDRGSTRHPQLGAGSLLGAAVTVMGAVEIGDGAKVGAGTVVLKSIPRGCTAVGVPAKILPTTVRLKAGVAAPEPALTMDQTIFLREWSDYNI